MKPERETGFPLVSFSVKSGAMLPTRLPNSVLEPADWQPAKSPSSKMQAKKIVPNLLNIILFSCYLIYRKLSFPNSMSIPATSRSAPLAK